MVWNQTLVTSDLPSLSDKLTSLRGYSQRKIKVLPQTDGRGLGLKPMNQLILLNASSELKT